MLRLRAAGRRARAGVLGRRAGLARLLDAAPRARRGRDGPCRPHAHAARDRARRAPGHALPAPRGPRRDRLRLDPRRPRARARPPGRRAQRAHDRAARLRRDEVELLLTIAAQVGQAIEHARLYGRAQARLAELEALERISRAIASSADLDEALAASSTSAAAAPARRGLRAGDLASARRPARRDRALRPGGRGRRRAGRSSPAARPPTSRARSPSRCATRRGPVGALVCPRPRRAFTRARADAAEAGRRARRHGASSARAARCAGCSPRRSTTASRTTCRPSPRCCAWPPSGDGDPAPGAARLGRPRARDRRGARPAHGARATTTSTRRPRAPAVPHAAPGRSTATPRPAGSRRSCSRREPRDGARARLCELSRTRSSTAAAHVDVRAGARRRLRGARRRATTARARRRGHGSPGRA